MRVYQLTRYEACEAAGSTQSEKMAWIAHLIGTRESTGCLYGSSEAKVEARMQRKALEEEKNGKGDPVKPMQKHARSESTSSQAEGSKQKRSKQSKLKAFKTLDMPFSAAEAALLKHKPSEQRYQPTYPSEPLRTQKCWSCFGCFAVRHLPLCPRAR